MELRRFDRPCRALSLTEIISHDDIEMIRSTLTSQELEKFANLDSQTGCERQRARLLLQVLLNRYGDRDEVRRLLAELSRGFRLGIQSFLIEHNRGEFSPTMMQLPIAIPPEKAPTDASVSMVNRIKAQLSEAFALHPPQFFIDRAAFGALCRHIHASRPYDWVHEVQVAKNAVV